MATVGARRSPPPNRYLSTNLARAQPGCRGTTYNEDAVVGDVGHREVAAIAEPDRTLARRTSAPRLARQGAEVVTLSSREQDQFFELERKRWSQVVFAVNLRAG